MNIRCRTLTTLILPILICISCPAFAQTNSLQDLFGSGTSINLKEIKIESNKASIENKKSIAVWSGDVKATTADGTTLICDKLEVYYHYEKPAEKKSQPIGDRMVVTGDVEITQSDGSVLTAEKAEYNNADEKIVLTGNPATYKSGDDLIKAKGSKITIDNKNEKIDIDDAKGDFTTGGKR